MSAKAPLGTDSSWSKDQGRGRGPGWSLVTRGAAGILLIVLLARAVVGARTKGATPPAPSSGWAEDLAEDRLFERSLVLREIAVILLIGLLIVIRQLLS